LQKAQVRISGNLPDAIDGLRHWLIHRSARLEEFSIKVERDGTAVVAVAFAEPHLADAFEADFGAENRAEYERRS